VVKFKIPGKWPDMTGNERILAAFRGQQPDYVPFSPNIYQWFYYHRYNCSLPAELAEAKHPLDVLRYLGADILARWDTQWATRPVCASSCNTSPLTPWENLVYFRDAARECGQLN
jgi:hypothetical protein